MILSSQFPVNLQAILKIEKFWTINHVLIMTFSHIYADDTKNRKAWKSWNPVNSALFPSPEPTAVIVSFWVVLKSLWLSFSFSFRLFYLQYPPPICGFGMRSGISHVCKVFIRKFLPKNSVKIFPSVFRMSGQNFPVGFQDVTSWKNFSIFLGDTIDR